MELNGKVVLNENKLSPALYRASFRSNKKSQARHHSIWDGMDVSGDRQLFGTRWWREKGVESVRIIEERSRKGVDRGKK